AGVVAALGRVREVLAGLGAQVVEVSLPHARYAVPAYYVLATAEASSNLARYDGMMLGARVGSEALGQEEVMRKTRGAALGREVRRRLLFGTHVLSSGQREEYYTRAARVRQLVAAELELAFGGCD